MYKCFGKTPDDLWNEVKAEAMKENSAIARRNKLNDLLGALAQWVDDATGKRIIELLKQDLPEILKENVIGTVSFVKE